jgi:hypothetical protein
MSKVIYLYDICSMLTQNESAVRFDRISGERSSSHFISSSLRVALSMAEFKPFFGENSLKTILPTVVKVKILILARLLDEHTQFGKSCDLYSI